MFRTWSLQSKSRRVLTRPSFFFVSFSPPDYLIIALCDWQIHLTICLIKKKDSLNADGSRAISHEREKENIRCGCECFWLSQFTCRLQLQPSHQNPPLGTRLMCYPNVNPMTRLKPNFPHFELWYSAASLYRGFNFPAGKNEPSESGFSQESKPRLSLFQA